MICICVSKIINDSLISNEFLYELQTQWKFFYSKLIVLSLELNEFKIFLPNWSQFAPTKQGSQTHLSKLSQFPLIHVCTHLPKWKDSFENLKINYLTYYQLLTKQSTEWPIQSPVCCNKVLLSSKKSSF